MLHLHNAYEIKELDREMHCGCGLLHLYAFSNNHLLNNFATEVRLSLTWHH